MTRSDFELPALWRYPSARHNPSALMHRVTLQARLPLFNEDLRFYTQMPQNHLGSYVSLKCWSGSVLRASRWTGTENSCLSSPYATCGEASRMTLSTQSPKLGGKKGQSYVRWRTNNAGRIAEGAGVTDYLLQPVGWKKIVAELELSAWEWEVRAPAPPPQPCFFQPHAWRRAEGTQYGRNKNLNSDNSNSIC